MNISVLFSPDFSLPQTNEVCTSALHLFTPKLRMLENDPSPEPLKYLLWSLIDLIVMADSLLISTGTEIDPTY